MCSVLINKKRLVKYCVAIILLIFSVNIFVSNNIASADIMDDIISVRSQVESLADEVNTAQDKYNKAQDAQDEATTQIKKNQSRIDEINEKLKPQREKLEQIIRWEYMNRENFTISVITNISNITEFFVKLDYMMKIKQSKAETMESIAVGQQELIEENKALQEQQNIYEEAKTEQQEIMDGIQPKIDELENVLDGLKDEQKELLGYKGKNGGGPAYDPPENGNVVDYALSRVGCPYVWAASGPNSFDCSGLIMWAYKQAEGKSLPHNSESQLSAGKRIPVSQAKPGDVLWRPGHVALCVKDGGEEYVHAPHSGANVTLVEKGSAGDWNSGKWKAAVRF